MPPLAESPHMLPLLHLLVVVVHLLVEAVVRGRHYRDCFKKEQHVSDSTTAQWYFYPLFLNFSTSKSKQGRTFDVI